METVSSDSLLSCSERINTQSRKFLGREDGSFTWRGRAQLFKCIWANDRYLYFAMYNVFGPQTSGKKSLVSIFNSILYLFTLRYLFLYYKEILAFIFNILWHKKFYITNNYKMQEQIQGISDITQV